MHNTSGRRRIRPTPAIIAWALVDVIALLVLAVGAAYLVHGAGFFFAGFPSSTPEALTCLILGLGGIVVAAIKMLAEVLKQIPGPQSVEPGKH